MDFHFRCSERWGDLTVTDHPSIRHCGRCESDVFYCSTDDETIAHAKAGHCIAREVPDGSELPPIFVGQPAHPIVITASHENARRWAARERGIDDSIRNAARTDRSCPRCFFPAPAWRTTCRVCGFEMGRSVGEPHR